MRKLFWRVAGPLLFLLLSLLVAPSGESLARDGRSPGLCEAHPLRDWSAGRAQWLGPCASGAANGLGALKFYENGALRETFFGEVRDGEAVFGVIDKGAGYAAGRVVQGAVVDTSDRNELIKAFRTASQAAQQVSENFAKKGNKRSAAYYHGVAQKLANQLD